MPVAGTLSPVLTPPVRMQFISKTISLRSTTISFDMLTTSAAPVRKTKIGFTMGPSCDDEEVGPDHS